MDRRASLGNTLFIATVRWCGYDFTMIETPTLPPAIMP
jgi:hypothetical protein